MDRCWQLLKFVARSSKRMAVLVVGLSVTGAGFAMLVLPGPGFIVIILGLAILATEFVWAEYLLDKAKEQALKAKDKAAEKINRRRAKRGLAAEFEPEPTLAEVAAAEPELEPEPERTEGDD